MQVQGWVLLLVTYRDLLAQAQAQAQAQALYRDRDPVYVVVVVAVVVVGVVGVVSFFDRPLCIACCLLLRLHSPSSPRH